MNAFFRTKHLLGCLLWLVYLTNSQAQSFYCATDAARQKRHAAEPNIAVRSQEIDQATTTATLQLWQHEANAEQRSGSDEELISIPIVVHLVYDPLDPLGSDANMTDSRVFEAIAHLNDAYRNIQLFDPSQGIDTRIAFRLAATTPDGTATNGITRLSNSTFTYMDLSLPEEGQLKQQTTWEPERYLNIWVLTTIGDSDIELFNIAGISSLPEDAGTTYDGIFIRHDYFGGSYINSKAIAHEVGHYLGLYHTFLGGCSNFQCLTSGDLVCDTPPDGLSSPTLNCTPINSCTTDAFDLSASNPFRPVSAGGLGDQPDLIENYMDYGGYLCQTHFTKGQKDRMRVISALYRSDLLNSNACNSTFANDAGIHYIADPSLFTCDGTNYKVILKNYGTNVLNNVTIAYQTDGGVLFNYPWTGALMSGQTIEITLTPPTSLTQATHQLKAFTLFPNSLPDPNPSNDIANWTFYHVNSLTPPLNDNFNNAQPSGQWLVVSNDGSQQQWTRTPVSGCSNQGAASMSVPHFSYLEQGQKDYLYTKINLEEYANATLNFDVAYARPSTTLADKLHVVVSNNCGSSFKNLYYKTGQALATVSETVNTTWQPSNCDQWRTETVSLLDYAGQEIIIGFVADNFHGNNLYLDNITITGEIDIPCDPPINLQLLSLSDNAAGLSWQNADGNALSYNLRYRQTNGTDIWHYAYNITAPYTLLNLHNNTGYETQIQAVCANGLYSGFTDVITFNTPFDPCPAPYNATLQEVDKDHATIVWESPAEATSYRIRYRATGTQLWFVINDITGSSYTLGGLSQNTGYQVELYSICNGNQSQSFRSFQFVALAVCSPPENVLIANVTKTTANVQWTGDEDATSFRLEHRIVGSTGNWSNITLGVPGTVITGLLPETLYEVRVRTYCFTTVGDFAPTIVFQTAAPCYTPTALYADAITDQSARLSWQETTNSSLEYLLLYKPKGVIAWDSLVVPNNSVELNGLEECQEYVYKIRTICDGEQSTFTPISSFTTQQTSGYCCAYSSNALHLWLKRFALGTYTNLSDNNGGYADFTDTPIDVLPGSNYNLSLLAGAKKKNNARAWDVWIDWNRDLSFADTPNEHMLTATVGNNLLTNPLATTGIVQVPAGIAPGPVRLRVAVAINVHASACGVSTSGEIEEYTLMVGTGKTTTDSENNNDEDDVIELLPDTNAGLFLRLLPNPADEQVEIVCRNVHSDNICIKIFDLNGREMLNTVQNTRKNHDGTVWQYLDVSALPTGIYMVQVSDSKGQKCEKLVVE